MLNIVKFIATLEDQDAIDALFIFPDSCVVVDADHSEEDQVLCESCEFLAYNDPIACDVTGFTHVWAIDGHICRVTWPVTEGCSAPCIYVVCGAADQEDL